MTSNTKNPYVGPRPFQRDDQDWYFGREREIAELEAKVISKRVVLFSAESGAGKSSLINTSLVPNLEAQQFEVLPVTRVSGVAPPEIKVDNIYVFNLILRLNQVEQNPSDFANMTLTHFLNYLAREETNDGEYRFYYDKSFTPSEILPRVLIIDQFEELLTAYPAAWDQRKAFFQQLHQAMEDDPYLGVLFSIREDYVARLDPFKPLIIDQLRDTYYMKRMSKQAAEIAIKEPAKKAGCPFEEEAEEKDTAKRLVENLSFIKTSENQEVAGPDIEPVQLQVVCQSIWESLKGKGLKSISIEDLEDLTSEGGDLRDFIDNSLGQFYEKAIDMVINPNKYKKTIKMVIDPDKFEVSELALRDWFDKKLITESQTRGTVHRGDMYTGGDAHRLGLANDIVDFLAKELFLLREETRSGSSWYELTHDRFIEPIKRSNQQWLLDRPLVKLAQRWKDSPADTRDAYLLGSKQLTQAESTDWKGLGPLVKEFINASREDQEEKKKAHIVREKARRQQEAEAKRLLDEQKLQRAEEQKQAAQRLAEEERLRTQAAQRLAEEERLRTQAEAHRKWSFVIAVSVALVIIFASIMTAYIRIQNATATVVAQNATATVVAQNAMATAVSRDATATAAIREEQKKERTNQALALASQANNSIDPDLSLLLAKAASSKTHDFDQSIIPQAKEVLGQSVWGASILKPAALYHEINHGASAYEVQFSPNGKLLATADREETVKVWDVETWSLLQTFSLTKSRVVPIAFNQDSEHLAIDSPEYGISIHNIETGELVQAFPDNHDGADIWSLAFSPDDTHLVAADIAGQVSVMTIADPDQSKKFQAHSDGISGIGISPDSRKLATASKDGQAKVWDLISQTAIFTITEHSEWINNIVFSPDGNILATASDDGKVTLWQAATGEKIEDITDYGVFAHGVVFNQTLQDVRIATVDASGSVRVWESKDQLVSWQDILAFNSHDQTVWNIALNPAGNLVATASSDGYVRVWKVRDGQEYQKVVSDLNLAALGISQDRSAMVVASTNGQIEIWDTTTYRQEHVLTSTNIITDLVDLALMSNGDVRLLARHAQTATVYHWTADDDLPPQPAAIIDADSEAPLVLSANGMYLAWTNEDQEVIMVKNIIDGTVQPLDLPQPPTPSPTPTPEEGSVSPPTKKPVSEPTKTSTPPTELEDNSSSEQSPSDSQDQRTSDLTIELLTLSPNGSRLAAIKSGNEVIVLDTKPDLVDEERIVFISGEQAQITSEQAQITSASFNHAGTLLATIDQENRGKIFDLALRGSQPRTFELPSDDHHIVDLAFSPDDTYLVIGEEDGLVHFLNLNDEILLDATCDLANRNLTNAEWNENKRDLDNPIICPEYGLHPSIVEHALQTDGENTAKVTAQALLQNAGLDASSDVLDEMLRQAKISLIKQLGEQGELGNGDALWRGLSLTDSEQTEIAQLYVRRCIDSGYGDTGFDVVDVCQRAHDMAGDDPDLHRELCQSVTGTQGTNISSCVKVIELIADGSHEEKLNACQIGLSLDNAEVTDSFLELCETTLAQYKESGNFGRVWNFCVEQHETLESQAVLREQCLDVFEEVPSIQTVDATQKLADGQVDIWKLEGDARQIITIDMKGVDGRSESLDAVLSLFGQDADDRIVEYYEASIDDFSGRDSRISSFIPQANTYFIGARDYNGQAGEYELIFNAEEPILLSSGESRLSIDSGPSIWRFNGEAGEIVTIKITGASGEIAVVNLKDKDLRVLERNNNQVENFFPPYSGDYFIEVENIQDYTIELNKVTPPAINIDQAQEVSIDSLWILPTDLGQVVDISLTSADDQLDPNLTLLNAKGSRIATDDDGGTGLNAQLRNIILTQSSMYIRSGIQDSVNEISGTLTITVNESGPPLIESEPIVDDLNGRKLWAFQGQKGEFVDLSGKTIKGSIPFTLTIISPSGNILAENILNSASLTVNAQIIAPDNGLYLVEIEPDNSISSEQPSIYELVLKKQDPEPITFATQPYSGTLTDSLAWTFAGKKGQLASINLDALGPGLGLDMVLYGPDGEILVSQASSIVHTLPANGSYSIVAPAGGIEGRYTLSLNQIVKAPTSITYGDIKNKTVEAGIVDYWGFTGKPGEAATITLAGNGSDFKLHLYNPNGEMMGVHDSRSTLDTSLISPLKITGTHIIAVSGVERNLGGSYSLTLTQTDVLPILAWTAYTDIDEEYAHVLDALNISGTLPYIVEETTTTDPDTLHHLLETHSVFLIPEQEDIDSFTLGDIGARFGPVLTNFVERGGRIVALADGGGFLDAANLLEALYVTEGYLDPFVVVGRQSPISLELPSSIDPADATDGYEITGLDAEVIIQSISGEAIVATRSIGSGQVILIGYDYYESNEYANQLLRNAIFWQAHP